MWCCSVMIMDVLVGRCEVVHTFLLSSDYCVSGSLKVVIGHGISCAQSTGVSET